jgi:DMSO/TMAO reductase YedYZ heme-binding membrane subunit
MRYWKVLILGLGLFGLTYWYLSFQKVPSPLNKAVADTSVFLMGFSMVLSFGLVHIGLSFAALERLFLAVTWQQNAAWPALTGLIAAVIFSLMTLVSNRLMASRLGGKTWKVILHTGYIAMGLVLAHVVLLKSVRWLTWYHQGMATAPATSLIVAGFIVVVLVMRMVLWGSLKKRSKNH